MGGPFWRRRERSGLGSFVWVLLPPTSLCCGCLNVMCTHGPPVHPQSLRPTADDSPLSLAPCTLSLSSLAMGPTTTLALYIRPLFHTYSGAPSSPPPSLQNQYGDGGRRPALQARGSSSSAFATVLCTTRGGGRHRENGNNRRFILPPVSPCRFVPAILIPTLQACTFSPSSLRDCLDYPRLTVDRFAGPSPSPGDYVSGRDLKTQLMTLVERFLPFLLGGFSLFLR